MTMSTIEYLKEDCTCKPRADLINRLNIMDEIFSLDILYGNEGIPDELYKLVRDGLYTPLKIRLGELSNPKEYLTTLQWYDGEQVSLLMVAALYGYDDIVNLLLTYWNSEDQVELKGKIFIFDQKRLDGTTALYCACYRGHFNVAKTLIDFGNANVNQDAADYPGCPLLLHATNMNRLDVVRFLIENKYSDVNETKSNNYKHFTALICAATKGYTDLIRYLIDQGANVNYRCPTYSRDARTPLLLAATNNHADAFRLLYQMGADFNVKDIYGQSIFEIAVKEKLYSILHFLLEQSLHTADEVELVACSSIDSSSSMEQRNDMLQLLRVSLQYRQSIGLRKVCPPSLLIYDYQEECQTIDELDSIVDNSDRIFLESLLIRERLCLTQKDLAIIPTLKDYGNLLASREKFDQCFNVWIHLYHHDQRNKGDLGLHLFIWLFCKILSAKRIIPVHQFLQVSYLTFKRSDNQYHERDVNNALFLLIIATKILEEQKLTKEEHISIYHWIQELCRQQSLVTSGKTLLHLCVDSETASNLNYRSVDTKSHIPFPNQSGLELLLRSGSRWLDIDAMDSKGNTALHIACQGGADQKIIELLLHHGCHIDSVNNNGRTPISYAKHQNIIELLMPKPIPTHLKCLCARLIAQKDLKTNCLESSNSMLKKFLLLHWGTSHSRTTDWRDIN